jgi:hypothetical protein
MSASNTLPTGPAAALTPAPSEKCIRLQNVWTASGPRSTMMKSISSPPTYAKGKHVKMQPAIIQKDKDYYDPKHKSSLAKYK